MADAVIGKAYLQVIPKMSTESLVRGGGDAGKGAAAAFGKSFGGGLGGVGSAASKAFGVVTTAAKASAVAAAAAIGVIGKQSFDAYASYEQLSGGIKKLFGDSASIVEQNAQQAYKTAGMSANQYMEQASGFAAALTNSLGGDTVKAASQADVAMRAISDNVNTFGTDIDSVTYAFQGFAKQQFGMLDNLKLGYGGSRSEMERLIKDANEWGAANGRASDLSIESFSDVITAIQQIQEKQSIAGTTAKEAATTIEGSINAAKSAWENWLAELGKGDADMGRVTSELVSSLQDVATNVIPAIGRIFSTVAGELPGLLATVGQQLGDTLVTSLDSATGGMATKAIEMVQPITDALSSAFGGIGSWLESNSGAIESVASSFGGLASTISSTLGGAISAVAPVIGDLASAALPALSTAMDFASAAISGIADMFSNLAYAVSPVTDALAPVIDAIGTGLTNAITWLTDQMRQVDFSEFATKVHDTLQGVVDFVKARIDDIKGFFEGVGKFIDDPIGTIQNGLADLFGATEGTAASVNGSFQTMANGAKVSTDSMVGSIRNVNGTPLNGKSASFTANGNVINANPSSKINDVSRATSNLQSKSIDINANGNVVSNGGGIVDNILGVVGAVGRMFSKSIDVTTNYRTTGTPGRASGGIVRRFAEGAIFTKPTMTDVGIVGEAGAEAIYSNGRDTGIFPLTNRRYTGPFASEIADQIASRAGKAQQPIQVTINGVSGPDEVARAVTRALTLAQM